MGSPLLVAFHKKAVQTVAVVVCFVGAFTLMLGVGVIAWQVYGWLSNAEWVPLSLLHALFFPAYEYVPDKVLNWLDHPQSWLGVHKMVYGALLHTPTSVFLIVVGGVMSLLGGVAARWPEEFIEHGK